ncbi:unnamed protein product [Sphagnum balticum]
MFVGRKEHPNFQLYGGRELLPANCDVRGVRGGDEGLSPCVGLVVAVFQHPSGELDAKFSSGWSEVGNEDEFWDLVFAFDDGDDFYSIDEEVSTALVGAVGGLVIGEHLATEGVGAGHSGDEEIENKQHHNDVEAEEVGVSEPGAAAHSLILESISCVVDGVADIFIYGVFSEGGDDDEPGLGSAYADEGEAGGEEIVETDVVVVEVHVGFDFLEDFQADGDVEEEDCEDESDDFTAFGSISMMELRWGVVEEFEGDDGDEEQEEGVDDYEVDKFFGDLEDGVEDDCHLLVGLAEEGEELDDGASTHVVVDQTVGPRDRRKDDEQGVNANGQVDEFVAEGTLVEVSEGRENFPVPGEAPE